MANTQKKPTSKTGKATGGKRALKSDKGPLPLRRELAGVVCFFLGVFALFGFFDSQALFVQFFATLLKGTLGVGFWLAPPMLFLASAILCFHRNRPVRFRLICTLLIPLFFACTCYGFIPEASRLPLTGVSELWNQGRALKGCGLFGSLIGGLSTKIFSGLGTILIFAVLTFFLGLGAINRSMMDVVDWYLNRPRYEEEDREAPRSREKKEVQFLPSTKAAASKEAVALSEPAPKKKAGLFSPLPEPGSRVHVPLGKEEDTAPEPVATVDISKSAGNSTGNSTGNSPAPLPQAFHEGPSPQKEQDLGQAFSTGEDLKVKPSSLSVPAPLVEAKSDVKTPTDLPKASPFGFFNKKKKVPTPDELFRSKEDPGQETEEPEKDLESPAESGAESGAKSQANPPAEPQPISSQPGDTAGEKAPCISPPEQEEIRTIAPQEVEMEQAPPPSDEDAPPLLTLPVAELRVDPPQREEPKTDTSEILQEHPIFQPLPSFNTSPPKATLAFPAPDPSPFVSNPAAPSPVTPSQPIAPSPVAPSPVAPSPSPSISAQAEQPRPGQSETTGPGGSPTYKHPPVSLLSQGGEEQGGDIQSELNANRQRLEDTIQSFNIDANIRAVTRGPSVTRYEVELDQGVKLSKLTNLSDDIALALGATGVRIAPIPDKISMVGIEVPNKTVSPVPISMVVGSNNFQNSVSKVSFAVGKDINGQAVVGNIAKFPHLLVAGTTGSGKSVCTNALIISLLYKASPEEVRLIMVDPKMVELGIYNGIPHLLIPVVTDPKKAAGALQWAVTEMMKRYRLFAEVGTRDLASFNELAAQSEDLQTMPQIVVVIDELADLMLVAAKEVEESICRVAQMGRASGMHLIIATQRPSADVITGLMKANIPSRIAFAVSSGMESRIILDTQGAEKLVGRGDMLYAPLGEGKPTRVQGCLISDKEVADVVSYVKRESGTASYSDEIMEEIDKNVAAKEKGGGKASANNVPAPELAKDREEDQDEMLEPAIDVVLETGQASVSFLQRRLKLGYARAARLVDMMEEQGVVGGSEGAKPRQILVTKDQWQEVRYRRGIATPPENSPTAENQEEIL